MEEPRRAVARWLFGVVVIPAVTIVLAAAAYAQQGGGDSARNQDFSFQLPPASCHPHCQPGQGDLFSITFNAPADMTISNAQLNCNPGPLCLLNELRARQVSTTKVVVEGLNRTASTNYALTIDLAMRGQPPQLPPVAAAMPPSVSANPIETINLISGTALQICGTVPLEGTGGNVKLSAGASAKVSGLISNLFSGGAEARAENDRQHYINVLQADLPKIIQDNTNCKLAVFRGLMEKLLPNR